MLTQLALTRIASFIDGQIVSGDFRIGSTTYPANLRRSILDGTTIRKQIYLTQNDPYGTVDRARLLTSDGQVFAERTDTKEHEHGKGLLLEFRITVEEV